MGHKLLSKNCIKCGVEYKPTGPHQKFCFDCRWGEKPRNNRGYGDKPCHRCGVIFTPTGPRTKFCLPCRRLAHQDRSAEFDRKVWDEILAHYGAECNYCGEKDPDHLSIDHKNGDGKGHRAKYNGASNMIWYEVRREGFPDTYQILCKVCNVLKYTIPHDAFVEKIKVLYERFVK